MNDAFNSILNANRVGPEGTDEQQAETHKDETDNTDMITAGSTNISEKTGGKNFDQQTDGQKSDCLYPAHRG